MARVCLANHTGDLRITSTFLLLTGLLAVSAVFVLLFLKKLKRFTE